MRLSTILAGGSLGLVVLASSASGATITSTDFSFAYGWVNSVGWTTSENAGTTSPTTQGNFTLSPAVGAGTAISNTGVTFLSRTLGNNVASAGAAYNDETNPFTVNIAGSYNGGAPGDASGTPNYQIQIEITSISIYGVNLGGAAGNTLAFDETTAGHAQTSPSTPLIAGDWRVAADYAQLDWDPSDYSTVLGALNDSFTRTITILPISGDLRALDGLEIDGRVHLIYDAVPEPSGMLLISLVGMAIMGRQRRFAA